MIRQIEEVLHNSVPVARIMGPHGLDGEVKAKILSNYSEVFIEGKEYFLYHPRKKSNLRVIIETLRVTGTRMTLKFKNYDRIEWAKKLEGFELYLNLDDLPPLREGEYYFFQLFGSKVFNRAGEEIGVVEDIIETGNADVLSIRKPFSGFGDPPKETELLVPVVKEFIVSMDQAKKEIVIIVPNYAKRSDENGNHILDE